MCDERRGQPHSTTSAMVRWYHVRVSPCYSVVDGQIPAPRRGSRLHLPACATTLDTVSDDAWRKTHRLACAPLFMIAENRNNRRMDRRVRLHAASSWALQ